MTKENTKDRTRATIELSRPLMAVDIEIFFSFYDDADRLSECTSPDHEMNQTGHY